MPRPRKSVPAYEHHKPSGQAYVRLPNGAGGRKLVYLGKFDSPESRTEYRRILAELESCPKKSDALAIAISAALPGITIVELIERFWKHAEKHYRDAEGNPTSELRNHKAALKPLKDLYGFTTIGEFGPLALKVVRDQMVKAGLCRREINSRIRRIRKVFKWGVEMELVEPALLAKLQAIQGLQANRCDARESDPIEPVDEAIVDATLKVLPRHVAGLIRFMMATGARPGEACKVRPCDIDKTAAVWVFSPKIHKNSHRGKKRSVYIGPKAQTLLAEFEPEKATDYYFSPARSDAEKRTARSLERVTPRYASHLKRNAEKRVKAPKRKPGLRYTASSLAKTVYRICKKHDIERWHPNQVRHSVASKIRRERGLESAQVILGHERADTTQIYAERNSELASKVAAELG